MIFISRVANFHEPVTAVEWKQFESENHQLSIQN